MIVYLARDIPAFVKYCVNGASPSSLLIESTYSMIHACGYVSITIAIPVKHTPHRRDLLCIGGSTTDSVIEY